jgi:Conjugative transposon protein TcpC
MRLGYRLARLLLHAAALAGLIASIRFALLPPRPATPVSPVTSRQADVAVEGFAAMFARAYLSWREDEPEAHRKALEPFTGSALAPEAGMQLPLRGSQEVISEQVVEEHEAQPGLQICSIAAQTNPGGLVYLTVSVLQRPDGSLALAGYPAFVGAPMVAPADPVIADGSEVEDEPLRTVIARALRNYLAQAPGELAADLAPGVIVTPPQQGLSLQALQSISWEPGARMTVGAQVLAVAADGARYTLDYEIGVTDAAGRWEITAIQMGAGT